MANQPKKYKKFVATAATATLVASAIVPVASAASLSDIAGNTHEAAITSLVDAGIINGYADGTFKPNKTLTRSDVVKLLGKYLVSEGYSIPSDAVTSPRFSDLTSKSNKELLEYAAVVADAGVFAGSNGKLLAGDPITRENMAIVLVRMVNTLKDANLEAFVASQKFDREVKDLNSAKAEARTAIDVLDFYDITTATNFLPKNTVTRGQFATFLNNVIKADFTGASVNSGTVKAINATTVEVTFAEEVGNVNDYKFEIAGLDIKNVAIKQSNKKTVVLTTAVQEGGKEYTVTVNGDAIGKFVGASAVLPTAIDIVEKSQQTVLGNQITVKAKVTVATGDSAAGIPVTFNIVNAQNHAQNPGGALNQPIVAEATTDANGVATYTYTRYASTAQDLVTADEVQAYATGKATVRSFGKVYWGAIQPLTLTEVAAGSSINNGASKQYKVKLAGTSAVGTKVNVAFKENLNVLPDKAVKGVNVTDANGVSLGYPGQYVTSAGDQTAAGYKVVELTLNANGETTFTLTGSNATVTPIVFVDTYSNTVNTDPSKGRFDATELFAQAAPVTFAKTQTLALAVENLGVSNAAAYKGLGDLTTLRSVANTATVVKSLPANTGGRTYKATLSNPDGKTVVSNTPVKVSVAYGTAQNKPNAQAEVYLYDINAQKVVRVSANTADGKFEYTLLTDTKGQVSFKLVGEKDAYATPTFFTETGDKLGLDANDLQTAGEIVYFGDAKVEKAKLLVGNKAENSAVVYEETEFIYSTVDQNDNEYESAQTFTVTFSVSTLGNVANVKLGAGTLVSGYGSNSLPDTVNQGSTRTYAVQSSGSKASIKVDATNGTQVSVTATAGAFPQSTASVTFAKLNNEGVAEGQEVRGKVVAIDRANNRILLTDSKGVNVYELTYGPSEIYYQGNAVTESTFEGTVPASLTPGQELHFVQKNGTTPAKFNNLGYTSGINLVGTTLKTIQIKGDNTSTPKVYDFGGQTVKANVQISGDKITLENATINGDVTVGKTNATVTDVLNDFALTGVTVNGTVTVNQGDGETFTLTDSTLKNVVLNIKEHIDLVGTSSIDVLNVNATGSYFTGTGTITTAILADGVALDTTKTGYKAPANVVGSSTATNPFTVATTSGDTASVTLSFSANVATSDVAVVDLATTSKDTATIAQGTVATELKVNFNNVTDVTTKTFEVTYKGLKYTVAYNKTTSAWTVTRK